MTELNTRRAEHRDPATTKPDMGLYNQLAVALNAI